MWWMLFFRPRKVMDPSVSKQLEIGAPKSVDDDEKFTNVPLSPPTCVKRFETMRRVDSLATDSLYTASEYSEKKWIEDSEARQHFFSILTVIYAMLVIVIASVIEFSGSFKRNDDAVSETIFYVFMYGFGIIFLLYCYLFIIHPGWFNHLLRLLHKSGFLPYYKSFVITKTGHSDDGSSSLYLRLGMLFFGSIGVVFFGLDFYVCLEGQTGHICRYRTTMFNLVLAGVFTFIQMHFLFCNSKISIIGSKGFAKLGFMHLLAVNIWTWLHFVLVKNDSKKKEPTRAVLALEDVIIGNKTSGQYSGQDLTINIEIWALNYFGDFATFLATCIIEYSLIGAGILFVMWRAIDDIKFRPAIRHKKKTKVRIDCSASYSGLFAGVLFLIACFVALGIYLGFYRMEDDHEVIHVFKACLYGFALVGCIGSLIRMRHLQYTNSHSSNAEFLDELLLFVGLLGEVVYCSTSLVCWFMSLRTKNQMEVVILYVTILRVSESLVQGVIVLFSSRLRAHSSAMSIIKPGKQFVTFLLIANVSLFFFHTLEGMKHILGNAHDSDVAKPYKALISAVTPLTVFFRFHSSVCFAEIWKHAYSAKHSSDRSTPGDATVRFETSPATLTATPSLSSVRTNYE